MTSGVVAELPFAVRKSVEDFQRFIAEKYGSHSLSWGIDAKQLIQSAAEEIGQIGMLNTNAADLISIGKMLRATLDPKLPETRACGYVYPTEEELFIRITAPSWPCLTPRHRFTIAHEYGHALFYSLPPGRRQRIIPSHIGMASREAKREEGLCDSFAATLLVPSRLLHEIGRSEPDLVVIDRWSVRLGVSREVLARRLLQDTPYWPETVLYLIRCTNQSDDVTVFRGRSRKRDRRDRRIRTGPTVLEQIQSAAARRSSEEHLLVDLFSSWALQVEEHAWERGESIWIRA